VSAKDPYRLTGLDQESLVVLESLQCGDDRVKGLEVTRSFASSAIDDQVFRVLGDIWIEVVEEAAEDSLLEPTLCIQLCAVWCVEGECEVKHWPESLSALGRRVFGSGTLYLLRQRMSESNAPEIFVHDDPDNDRYVVEVDGEVAGFSVYHMRGGRHFFVHTEIDPGFEGHGVGHALAQFALDDVKAKGGKIIPLCPFIRRFVEEHPEYDFLIDHKLWDRIESRMHDDG
jgi:predicted GNAT family acetyltransferase